MLLALSITLLASLLPVARPPQAVRPASGRIVFAANLGANGAIDIFSSDLGGETIANLTADDVPDRSPSWSPDGTQIVFSSRRENNWDLYLIYADGSGLRRLTDDPAYDGEPDWSPDGRRIVFTSSRDGNLELYTLELETGVYRRLTDNDAADTQPAWAPGSDQIAFTSWRDGNQEVYRLRLGDGQDVSELFNVSDNPAPDRSPAWSPDGNRLAFISDREGNGNLHVLDLRNGSQELAGPLNRSLQDPSWTPTGGLVAVGGWTSRGARFSSRQGVLITGPGNKNAVFLIGSQYSYAEPDWSMQAINPAVPAERILPGRPAVIPATPLDLTQIPEGLSGLGDIRSGGRPFLASAVLPSFLALRQRVIEESGYDFLSRLSEATRAVSFRNGTSSYTSWHKAGRAFDTLFDYQAGGRQVLYISPEWRSGRLFWRLYLRAKNQDGSKGAPIMGPVFNTASRELLPPPSGYFIDFTGLAAEHGWNRIAAQERETFDWRSEPLALEYWHFERRDGLSWYQAMSRLYDDGSLKRLFGPEQFPSSNPDRPPSIPGNLGLPWGPQPIPPISGGYVIAVGRPR